MTWACYPILVLKGKLAHNFMISYLVLISPLSDMVRTFIVDKNAKIDFIHIYREKKILFQDPCILGFPNSPCATSLEGEFPGISKGFLSLIIKSMLN